MTTATVPTSRFGKAEALGFDPAGGPWVALCDAHNTTFQTLTRDKARAASRDTASFCKSCQAGNLEVLEVERFEPTTPEQLEAEADWNEEARLAQEFLELENRMTTADVDVPANEQPVLGTYRIGDMAHNALSTSGMYFKPVCNPDKAALMSEPVSMDDPNMCPYCLAGLAAPAEEPVKAKRGRKPKVAREPKVEAAPVVPAEPIYPELLVDFETVTGDFTTAMTNEFSVADGARALELLMTQVEFLKAHMPRRRVGRPTGARSGLVKQSATVNPSDQMGRVQQFADAGDKRALDILEHFKAYVPDADCSYCAEKGRMTRHGYASAFCSVGRELRAMELRATSAETEN